MKCYECESKRKLQESLEPRDLDGVAIVERLVFRCPKCKAEWVGDKNSDEVFATVARELALLERELTLDELRWLRKHIGASSKLWAGYLDVSPETFSRWENGERPYPRTSRLVLRQAAMKGPQSWPYDVPSKPKKPAPLELKYNSAARLVRV